VERKPGNLFSKFIEEIKEEKGGKLITNDLYGWNACQRRKQYIVWYLLFSGIWWLVAPIIFDNV